MLTGLFKIKFMQQFCATALNKLVKNKYGGLFYTTDETVYKD